MTRADQRRVLEAFSRDHTRELPNLLAADLDESPQFVFQQLYNRLQWDAGEVAAAGPLAADTGPLAALLAPAFARRSVAGAPLWLHAVTRRRQSAGLVRTLAGHTSCINACAFSPRRAAHRLGCRRQHSQTLGCALGRRARIPRRPHVRGRRLRLLTGR